MRVLIRAAVLALAILVGVLNPTAEAVSDHGNPAITRLWSSTDDGYQFVCTASYTQPYLGTDRVSLVLTAGHCQDGRLIRRNANDHIFGIVQWIASLFVYNPWLSNRHSDVALGVVPEVRGGAKDKLWLANATPEQGGVYIHGFPAGVEAVTLGFVVHPALVKEFTLLVPVDPWGGVERKSLADLIPGTRVVITPAGSVKGGSSGSPLLNEQGNVVGVLWGTIPAETRIQFRGRDLEDKDQVTLFTPIERVHDLLKLLELK